MRSILFKPQVTEKSLKEVNDSLYVFVVAPDSTKTQIKTAVEEAFKVKVASVNIVNRKGKMRRVGKKMTSKKLADTKMAYVKLSEGKITIFPQQ